MGKVGEDPVTAAIETSMADAGLNESPDTEPATRTAADPDPAAPAPDKGAKGDPPAVDEESELATLEQELVSKEPKLKQGKISVSRHQAVLTRARNQYETKVAELDKRIAALADYEKPEWALKRDALALAEKHPGHYLDLLLEDARYQAEIEKRYEARSKAAPAPATVVEKDDPEPEPDKLYEDGSVGYTVAQAKALSAWQARQTEKTFDTKLAGVRKEFEPLVQERKQTAIFEAQVKKMDGQIKKARDTWDGFKEAEDEIQAHFLADPTRTLYESYIAVVIPRLKADKTKIETETRAAIIKEMNDRSAPPARPGPGARPEATADPNATRDISDIIREKMRKLAASENAA